MPGVLLPSLHRSKARLESELERFIASSSAAQAPTEDMARQSFSKALAAVKVAKRGREEATALKEPGAASNALARVLSP